MATNSERLAGGIVGRFSLPKDWLWSLFVSSGLLLLAIYASRLVRKSSLRRLPLPPGPRGLPILGSLLQVANTKTKPWLVFLDWSKQYGDLVYVNVFGQTILVLNSLKAVNDLLEKRGSNYADRFVPPSMSLIRVDWSMAIMSYGPLWRAHRRMFHQYYNKTQIHKYSPVVEQQMSNFIRRLNSEPHNFLEHTQHLFGAIIIQISYGFNKPSQIESLSHAAETIVHTFADCATPGYFLVDVFPILRLVPEWFPGAAWKRRLLGVGKVSQDLFRSTFDDALEQARVSDPGEAQDVAAKIIANLPPQDHPDYARQEQLGRATALVAYSAGADTTVSSAHTLFVALANHPECQHAAQEELDATIGSDRLPAVADLPHLPYIQALVKELSRWFSVAPMGIAHISSQDDTYEGYFIPKGTTVMGNSWAIMHDPEIFEDPLEFKPERYLMRDPVTHQTKINPDVLDPESAAFGYGRRICPGRHLSNEALTLMTASLLSVFNVNAPKDPVSGLPIEVELKIGNGLLSSPAPFEVEIVPRSARHAALVLRED